MIKETLVRVGAYVLSSSVAWAFYTAWMAAQVGGSGSSQDRLTAALFLCVFGGFSATLVLLTLPWVAIVWIYGKTRISGAAYFTIAGLLLMVVIGSATASLSPKPLFGEDQTFLEGVEIALQRQGICFVLAGAIVGIGYWFLAERNIMMKRSSSRREALHLG